MLSLLRHVLRHVPRSALLFAALSACLSAHAQPVVRVGTGDWVPYVDQQREDGGALSRLVRDIFKAAGYQVEFVYYPWDRNLLMLEQGGLDAVMPYSCSAPRRRISECSDPVVQGEIVLFQRTGQQLNWGGVEDLKAFSIATTLGYSYGPQFDAAVQSGALKVQQSGKEDTGFRLLELGRVDFHPQDRAVGYAMLRRMFTPEARALITHHPRVLNTEPLHLLFRKGDAKADQLRETFNAGLRRLAQSGELQRLQKALYSGNADQWRAAP
ncbi:transporter substrate-binding domain-containing protein [Pseudomonas anguilliseptica]|nr:transporter substrate-binding domain-containing protein [Pseudomonas anguilliseptica]MCZ4321676.1 transporter substrate-binding domain-containing protein [Pseudomonas anguilliseptica]